VLAANRLATGGLKPDLTLVLDLPAEVGLARGAGSKRGRDRIEGEDLALHRRVAAAFAAAQGPGIIHLDAARPADELADSAWTIVNEMVRKPIPGSRG
jgi:dTMP kinase